MSERYVPLRRTANEWHQHLNVWVLMAVMTAAVTVAEAIQHVWWVAIIFAALFGLSGAMWWMIWFIGLGRHE